MSGVVCGTRHFRTATAVALPPRSGSDRRRPQRTLSLAALPTTLLVPGPGPARTTGRRHARDDSVVGSRSRQPGRGRPGRRADRRHRGPQGRGSRSPARAPRRPRRVGPGALVRAPAAVAGGDCGRHREVLAAPVDLFVRRPGSGAGVVRGRGEWGCSRRLVGRSQHPRCSPGPEDSRRAAPPRPARGWAAEVGALRGRATRASTDGT